MRSLYKRYKSLQCDSHGVGTNAADFHILMDYFL